MVTLSFFLGPVTALSGPNRISQAACLIDLHPIVPPAIVNRLSGFVLHSVRLVVLVKKNDVLAEIWKIWQELHIRLGRIFRILD